MEQARSVAGRLLRYVFNGWLKKAEKEAPFGRLVKPAEVARAVAYLTSDESGLMTGSIIDFDQQVLGSAEGSVRPERAMAL